MPVTGTLQNVLAWLVDAFRAALAGATASSLTPVATSIATTSGKSGVPDVPRGRDEAGVRAAVLEVDPKTRQMQRLLELIHSSARRSERAVRCHARAAQRIDAAIYELEQLRAEIATVIRPKPVASVI